MSYLDHLDEFQCQRCLKCCTNPGYIYIATNEISRISEHLNITEETFVNSFCDLIEKPRLTLKNKPDGSCLMLEGNTCRIHSVKPAQCRDFPTRWKTQDALEYCKGLQALFTIYK
ncbi:MAG: YkgJ family cysteine cluster protein [Candidatus Omnitrophica bacterium]|nr:YkgJ family cysteine cluster protein [Candidatus Omnitrophota bacterium]